jgi:hypothetical protein
VTAVPVVQIVPAVTIVKIIPIVRIVPTVSIVQMVPTVPIILSGVGVVTSKTLHKDWKHKHEGNKQAFNFQRAAVLGKMSEYSIVRLDNICTYLGKVVIVIRLTSVTPDGQHTHTRNCRRGSRTSVEHRLIYVNVGSATH